MTIPVLPPVTTSRRRVSVDAVSPTSTVSFPYPVYGDGSDLLVEIDGVPLLSGWSFLSPSGPVASIYQPITDGYISFATPKTGLIEVFGRRQPRRTAQLSEGSGPTARDFNLQASRQEATARELRDDLDDIVSRALRTKRGQSVPAFDIEEMKGRILGFDGLGVPRPYEVAYPAGASAFQQFETFGDAVGATIPDGVGWFLTLGYLAAFDGGDARWQVVSSDPAPWPSIPLAGGKYGKLRVDTLRPQMFGAFPYRGLDPNSSPDCTPGLTAMFAAADVMKVPVWLAWGIYRLASALPRPICAHYLQIHWEAGAQLYADYNEADNTRGVLAFITYAAVMTGFMNISKRNGTTGGVALSFVVTTNTANIGAMIIDSGWLTAANFYTPPGWTNPTSLYLDGTANDSAAVGFRDFFADQLLVFGNAILKGVRLPQIANGIVGGTLDLRGIANTPGDLTGAYPYTDGVQFSGLVGGDVYFGETRRSVVRAAIGGNVYNTKYNAGTGEWGSLFCRVEGHVSGITETNWMAQRFDPATDDWLGPPVDEYGNKSYSHSTAQMGYIVARDSDASGFSGWELYSDGRLKKWGVSSTSGGTGLVNVNVNTYEFIRNGAVNPGRGPAFGGYRLGLKTSNKNAGAGNAPDNQIYDLDANWTATPFIFTAKGKIMQEPVLGSAVILLASIAFFWEVNGDAA